jgi:hypothetical protein
MDFLADIVRQVKASLAAAGIGFDANLAAADPVLFLAAYYEFNARRIAPRARQVEYSAHLLASSPWKSYGTAIENIKTVSEAGQDLFPYQSTRVGKFEYHDLLLNDWGIQHFHLGAHSRGQQFAARTGDLLYATVESDRIRCLAILTHGSLADSDLLEIIEAEWPEYLDSWEIKDLVALGHIPSPEEVRKLRAAHIQSVLQLSSGRVLATPGGGYALSGTSIRAMIAAQRAHRVLTNAERFVRQHEASLRGEIGGPPNAPFRCTELSSSHIGITVDGAPAPKLIPIQ